MDGNLVSIAAEQVLVMFIIMGVGYAATKLHVIKSEMRAGFGDLLVNIVLPCMIIDSYLTESSEELAANLITTTIVSVVVMLVCMAVSALVCVRMKDKNKPLIRFGMSFCNAGYMGFPLISALFGSEGLLYASIFHTVYNLVVWSVGVQSLEPGEKHGKLSSFLQVFKKPALIAVFVGLVLYFTQISLPDVITRPIELIGDMNTPLAMFITGMIIAESQLTELIKDRRLWLVMFTRMLLIPVIVFGLCVLAGIDGMVGSVIVMLSACPCASLTSVMSVRYHYDESLGAGMVVVSTLLSILVLPLFAALVSAFFW